MTITLEIRPEVEAELARQAAVAGRALEDHAAALLEYAAQASQTAEPDENTRRLGQRLVDASARVRGLFSDEEIDEMFARNRSSSRPVNFE